MSERERERGEKQRERQREREKQTDRHRKKKALSRTLRTAADEQCMTEKNKTDSEIQI